MSNLLPGYMTLPGDKEQSYADYIAARAYKPMRPNQLSYWQNYDKFHVSLMKAWWGDAATTDNHWCYDCLPKLDKAYDMLQVFELMNQGKMNGFFCQGFNPLAAVPNKAKLNASLAKLKYLVVIDPLATETSCFWENHGEYNDVDPSRFRPRCSACPPPASPRRTARSPIPGAGCNGTARGPTRRGMRDPTPTSSPAFSPLRELYRKEGGAFPDPILNLTWPYGSLPFPPPRNWQWSITARLWQGPDRSQGPDQGYVKKGQQLDGFAQLQGRRLNTAAAVGSFQAHGGRGAI